jgi:hypothetical protein
MTKSNPLGFIFVNDGLTCKGGRLVGEDLSGAKSVGFGALARSAHIPGSNREMRQVWMFMGDAALPAIGGRTLRDIRHRHRVRV